MPETRNHRAMMIRHRLAMDYLQSHPDLRDDDRYDWLLAVVAPEPDLLAASLKKADEEQRRIECSS